MATLNRDCYIILGTAWEVVEVQEGDARIDDLFGKVSFATHTIYISADRPYFERLETLIHETIHIICAGREKVDLTEEDDVRTFSQILVDTLARNQVQLYEYEDDEDWEADTRASDD